MTTQTYIIDGFMYNIMITYAELVSYSGSLAIIDIPDKIMYNSIYYPISFINENAFRDNASLVSVTMTDNITNIGSNCFSGCINLTDIRLSSRLMNIQPETFLNCNFLNIILPDTITYISYRAFYGCSNLISIIWPKNLIKIYPEAFYNCYNLTDLQFPTDLEFIGERAFSNCSSVVNIQLPEKIKYIESYAFELSNISHIEIPSLTIIGFYVFKNCSNLTTVIFLSNDVFNNVDGISSSFTFCYKLQHIYINYYCLDLLLPDMFDTLNINNLIAHIPIFSPPPLTQYKYIIYPIIKYEYYNLNNFLIGTYDKQLYTHPDNVSINEYIETEKQIIFIPNNYLERRVDRILSNVFTNIKVAIFPPTKFTIEKDAFTNINTFVFTRKLPIFEDDVKYENAYINYLYDTPKNRVYLNKYFNNVYTNFPTGCNIQTNILCNVNGIDKYISVRRVRKGTVVKTHNDYKRVIKVIKYRTGHPSYVLNNLSVYEYTGTLVDELSSDSICYGKFNEQYIVAASSNRLYKQFDNTSLKIMYNFIFDTTDEFTCYYADGIPIITPVIYT
jgi:hypothetical protein